MWRSALLNGVCPSCVTDEEHDKRRGELAAAKARDLVQLFGPRAVERFTFQRYVVDPSNRAAFEQATAFDPSRNNLYFWGPPGVGKTHLAVAAARKARCRGLSVAMFTPPQLVRRMRMRPPEEEQQIIDQCVRSDVLVLDDFGLADSAYYRHVLQEILDGRCSRACGGLLLTSLLSLAVYRSRTGDLANSSRLAGLCDFAELRGRDRRAGTASR